MEKTDNLTLYSAALAQRILPERYPSPSSGIVPLSKEKAAAGFKEMLGDEMLTREEESETWLTVTLVEGRGMPQMDLFGTLNPYCVALLAGDRLF
jgi:hypothetical protein